MDTETSQNLSNLSKKMRKVKLVAGRSNVELAQLISKKINVPLTDVKFDDFKNTEIGVEITETVRGFDVYIVQTGCCFGGRSTNDHIIELEELVDASVLSDARTVTVIVPCFPYARSDKHDRPRVSIGSARIARSLKHLGVDRIITIDLHAGQTQGTVQLPFDNFYAKKCHIEHLRNVIFKGMSETEINEKFVLASPDMGGIKRVESYARSLKMQHVILHKHRDYDKISTVLNSELFGKEKVKDKTVIIIDDIFDSFGTIQAASLEIMKFGAKDIIAVATHGIFSGDAIDKINNTECIKTVIVTNSLPQQDNTKKSSKISVVDISVLLGRTIETLQTGGSISKLFE